MGARKSYRIKITVQGKAEADALFAFIGERENWPNGIPDFVSANGPVKKPRTKDHYTLSLTIPAKKDEQQ